MDTRILIVDDHLDVRMALQMSIQRMNERYIASVASDGFEALDILREAPFDLVITDYMMPGMDGLELVESIRALSPDVQIILTTALQDKTLKKLLADAQIKHFLPKPFTSKDIHQMVNKALTAVPPPPQQAVPALKRPVYQTVNNQLRELRRQTGAYACFVVASAGYVIASEATDQQIPVSALASLMAANAMATAELSKLLGNPTPFQTTILESGRYNVASYTLADKRILSVVFGKQVKIGLVQHFARRTAADLPALLPPETSTLDEADFFDDTFGNDAFEDSINSSLDDLFLD